MPPFRRLSRGLSFNLFPQTLLLSQYSPSLVALIAVSVLTCASISNDEPPPFPLSTAPNVTSQGRASKCGQPVCGDTTLATTCAGAVPPDASVNVHSSPCYNSSTLDIACSCHGAPLASCAGGALHSNALFNLIDVWAGISSFTDAFNKIPEAVIHTHYWIENNPTAVLSLESNYPQSTGSKDFYDYFWNSWRPPDDQPTVVVAGPSCCHLSVAGKRLRQWDPRSSQGLDTAKLAVHFNATILVIENVAQLLDEDLQHGLLSEIDSFMVSNGYNSMCCWRLQDSHLGGCTSRERVFAMWEKIDFAASLPPLAAPPQRSQPSNIRAILSPVGEVGHLVLPGEFTGTPTRGCCDKPVLAGSLLFGGIDCPWIPGCSFTLPRIPKYDKYNYFPSKIWRLLKIDGECVQVFDDVKRRPQFRWIHRSNLRIYNRVAIKWPVLNIDGVSKAVRSSNFPPNDLILDTRFSPPAVRPFSSTEKWRLQRLSEAKLAHLNSLVAQEVIGVDEVTARAGNSIASTMVDAVARLVSARIAAHQELAAARKEGKCVWMALPAQLQCSSIVATVLLISTSKAPFQFLLIDASKIPVALQPSSPEQSLNMATRWATQLGASSAPDVCFPLHKPFGNSVIRAVICPQLDTFEPIGNLAPGVAWTPLESLWDSNLIDLLVMAVERIQSHTQNVVRSQSTWLSGKVSGVAAVQPVFDETGPPAEWLHSVKACHRVEQKLVSALFADTSEHALYLQSWAGIAKPVDTSELAPHLKRSLVLPADWCQFASPNPHQAIESQFAPLPSRPSHQRRPAPLGWLSAIVASRRCEAELIVNAFVKQLTLWLSGKAQRPATQAIPGSWMEPWIYTNQRMSSTLSQAGLSL